MIGLVLLLAVSLSSCGTGTSANYEDAARLLTEVKTTQYFSEEKVMETDIEKILSAGVNAPSSMNTQPWHFTAVTDPETNQKLADAMGSMGGMMPSFDGADAAGEFQMPEGMPENISGFSGEMPEDMPEDFSGFSGEMPENMPGEGSMPPEGVPEDFAGFSGEMPGNMPGGGAMPPEGSGNFSKASDKAGIGDAPLTIVISCEEGSELSAGLAIQNMAAEAQLLGYGTKIMTAPAMSLNSEEYKALLNVPEGQTVAAVLLVGKAASAEENTDATASATTRNPYEDVVTVIGD